MDSGSLTNHPLISDTKIMALEGFRTGCRFDPIIHEIMASFRIDSDTTRRHHLQILSNSIFSSSTRDTVTELTGTEQPFSMHSAGTSTPRVYRNALSDLMSAGIASSPTGENPLFLHTVVSYTFRCAAEEDLWHHENPSPNVDDPCPNHFSFFDSRTGRRGSPDVGTYQRIVARTLLRPSTEATQYLVSTAHDPVQYAWACSMMGKDMECVLKSCCPPETQQHHTMDHACDDRAAAFCAPLGHITHPHIDPTFAHTFIFQVSGVKLWFLCPPTPENLKFLDDFVPTTC
ncbi:hypothetical protein DL93DRAFT_2234738 [Clavulina sp. PMI_390]|nr:hypothetical protein DL93DRAFT_2234738 [Clavulina sp. PMI_390]